MFTIFLSYSSADRDIAVDLREALTAKGHLVRYDVTDVVPGDDWRRVLTEGLQQSDATVALISTKTLSYLRHERNRRCTHIGSYEGYSPTSDPHRRCDETPIDRRCLLA